MSPILYILIRYYAALRISVAAASPEVVSLGEAVIPAPIVRPLSLVQDSRFDRREVIECDTYQGVLTVPIESVGPEVSSVIGEN